MPRALLSLLCVISASAGFAAEPKDSIRNLLDSEIRWSSGPGMDDFFYICRTLRIPCGEEKYESDVLSARPELKTTDATPRTILNAIVDRYPGYQWYFVKDVLVIRLPVKERAASLQTEISDFSLSKVSVSSGIRAVAHKMRVASPGRSEAGLVSHDAIKREVASNAQKINLNVKHDTAEQVLCRVVSTHGHAMWQLIHQSRSSRDNSGLYMEAEVY